MFVFLEENSALQIYISKIVFFCHISVTFDLIVFKFGIYYSKTLSSFPPYFLRH